jgi:hypothetical protein
MIESKMGKMMRDDRNTIDDLIEKTAEKYAMEVDQKLQSIVIPLLGDKGEEFQRLLKINDLNGLGNLLNSADVRIHFITHSGYPNTDGWNRPTREWIVFQGTEEKGRIKKDIKYEPK